MPTPAQSSTRPLIRQRRSNHSQFTLEQRYSDNPSNDFHLFYVGRDDVHDILKHVLSRVSISLYLNRPWTRPIWERCRAEDGRDWMLNSGLFRIDHRRAGWRVHAAAALLFATYPWCLWLGERAARKR